MYAAYAASSVSSAGLPGATEASLAARSAAAACALSWPWATDFGTYRHPDDQDDLYKSYQSNWPRACRHGSCSYVIAGSGAACVHASDHGYIRYLCAWLQPGLPGLACGERGGSIRQRHLQLPVEQCPHALLLLHILLVPSKQGHLPFPALA